MPRVLIADPLSPQALEILTGAGIYADLYDGPKADLSGILGSYQGLLVRSETQVTSALLDQASQLELIGRAGVGVDNVDVEAATRKGIIVMNTPDGNTLSAAEHTFALLLALARNLPQAHQSLVEGRWDRKSFKGVEVNHKVLGVLGLGKIGTQVAKRAQAFGMEVYAFDPLMTKERAEQLNVRLVSLEEVLQKADFLTVHTPLVSETYHLLAEKEFMQMKKGVRLINCARGGIVKEEALLASLKAGKVAGAALDVFETEPLPADHPLRGFPNVVHTPHLGASTVEAQKNVAIQLAEQVVDYFQQNIVRNAVNFPSINPKTKPYLGLAEKIGYLAGELADGPISKATISCFGDLAEMNTQVLRLAVLKGFLSRNMEHVTYVNAEQRAHERGILVNHQESQTVKDYQNLLVAQVETSTGKRTVKGTLFSHGRERIVGLDDFEVECIPTGHMVIFQYQGAPGIVGKIGTSLGNAGIDIKKMLSYDHEDRRAVAIFTLRQALPPALLEQLATEIPAKVYALNF